MAEFLDQAEGLRRMLAAPQPRVLVVASAVSLSLKQATLHNLAASLASMGSAVLLLNASQEMASVEAAMAGVRQVRSPDAPAQRAAHYQQLKLEADVLLVDAQVDEHGALPVAAMAQEDVMVLVSPGAESITAAYALIKRLSACHGQRRFGLLVTHAAPALAQRIYDNMAGAASRYLGLELVWMGTVPADEHLMRALHLGRSVIEAFPKTGAAVAFRDLAVRLSAMGSAFAACSAG